MTEDQCGISFVGPWFRIPREFLRRSHPCSLQKTPWGDDVGAKNKEIQIYIYIFVTAQKYSFFVSFKMFWNMDPSFGFLMLLRRPHTSSPKKDAMGAILGPTENFGNIALKFRRGRQGTSQEKTTEMQIVLLWESPPKQKGTPPPAEVFNAFWVYRWFVIVTCINMCFARKTVFFLPTRETVVEYSPFLSHSHRTRSLNRAHTLE